MVICMGFWKIQNTLDYTVIIHQHTHTPQGLWETELTYWTAEEPNTLQAVQEDSK